MIKAVIGNNVNRTTTILPGSTTISAAVAAAGIASNGALTVNGSTFRGDASTTTLAEVAKDDKVFIFQIAKADNA